MFRINLRVNNYFVEQHRNNFTCNMLMTYVFINIQVVIVQNFFSALEKKNIQGSYFKLFMPQL